MATKVRNGQRTPTRRDTLPSQGFQRAFVTPR